MDEATPRSSEEFRVEENSPRPGTGVLVVHGAVDLHVAGELRDHLTALSDKSAALIVDLTEVTFVDSMTLGVLLGALKRARSADQFFRLVVPHSDLRRTFELTLLDRVFDLDSTLDESLAAIAAAEWDIRQAQQTSEGSLEG